jgi:GrpB-like predicted nucleotidyltransferase (UPF0157 family)
MDDDEPLIDAHLREVLVEGPRPRTHIELVEYDPRWPAHFAEHEARVRRALGDCVVAVEHIGSTAVPGLAAKPVVDVLVVVAVVEGSLDAPLEHAGYRLAVREAGHRCFVTPARDANIHLWPQGSPEIERYLLLRDRLRADAGDRTRYEARKRELAARPWADVNYYAQAKSSVIEEIIASARADRAG